VGLSVGPAFKVFRELASAARAARAAKAGEEAVLALKNAAEELTAEELGAEKAGKLAEKVAADAELAQSGGMAGMTPEEAVELGAEDIVRGHPPGRVDPASLEQADLLAQSSVIDDGKALSTAQREAEISIVAQSEPQPSTLEGYVDEVDLGNGHTWRRGEGSTWCRFSGSSLCGTVIPGDKQLARLRTRLTEYGMRPGRARQAGNLRSALDEMAARGDPKATLTIIESIEDALASERLPTRAGTITVDMHDARVSKAFNEAMAAPGLEGNPDWDEYRELVQDRYTTQGSIEIGPSPRSSDPAHVARTEEMRARFLAGMRDGKVSAGAAQMTRDHLARAVRLAGSEAGAVAARDAIWIDRFTGARLLGPGPNAALWPADPLWGVWRVDHIVELQHGGLEMESNYAAAPQRMHAIKSSAMNEFGRIISGIMGAAD
jgi:hypothetical protein